MNGVTANDVLREFDIHFKVTNSKRYYLGNVESLAIVGDIAVTDFYITTKLQPCDCYYCCVLFLL